MSAILAILVAAAAALGVARWLFLPSAPLLVLAGVALAATGLPGGAALYEQVMSLGLTFLVFAAGTEMNPARVGPQRRAAVRVGVAQFLLVALLGFSAATWLGMTLVQSAHVALALTASSTLVVLRLLQRRQQMFEPFGRMVVGVLLLQDLLIILLISALSQASKGTGAVAAGLAATVGLMVAAYVGLRWVNPYLLLKLKLDEESQLLVALMVLFSFSGAAYAADLPPVSGAFLAGMSLSTFPVNGILRAPLASLSDFFLSTFFVALGASLTVPSWGEFGMALAFAALVVSATPPLVAWMAWRAGQTVRSAVESGLLLAQTSEFSLIVGLVGRAQGTIDDRMMGVIAAVTVATMMLTPFLATNRNAWFLARLIGRRGGKVSFEEFDMTESRFAESSVSSGHVVLLGCGENGRRLLKRLLREGRRVAVIDDDAAVIAQVKSLGPGVAAIRGHGADARALEAASARQASVIISTLRRPEENEAVIVHAQGVPVILRVFEPDLADRLRSLGGMPILESHAAADDTMRWIESRFPKGAAAAPKGAAPAATGD